MTERIIELNSLSAQPTDLKKPDELIYPPAVTEAMLKNASEVLGKLDTQFPDIENGLSLHAGAVIDLKKIEDSEMPITSIDTPDIGFPSELLQKVIDRPQQLVSHIGWRLNSSLGLTETMAQTNRMKTLEKVGDLLVNNRDPFIRVSAESDASTGKPSPKLITEISTLFPQATIAVEYNAEEMTVYDYLFFVQSLRNEGVKASLSIDLAHIYEYFAISDKRDSETALTATLNVWKFILEDEDFARQLVSVDINNIAPNTKEFGTTHTGILQPGGALPMERVLAEYRDHLSRYRSSGRINIEPSPKDINLLLDDNGFAYLSQQILSFTR